MTNLIQLTVIVLVVTLIAGFSAVYFIKCKSKRAILCCVIPVFIMVFIAGCSSGGTAQSSAPSSQADKKVSSAGAESKSQAPAQKAPAEEKKNVKKASDNAAFKQLAFQGKMEGVELKVGSSYQEIIDKLGKPQKQNSITGGEVLVYGDASYIITPDTKKVVCIMVGAGKSLFGVKVGMKPEEIKQVLGEPDFEGHDDFAGIWNLSYYAGNYTLIFNSEEEDTPTIMAFLQSAVF